MSEEHKTAALLLFEQIADHKFDESPSYEEMFSSSSNDAVLEQLVALCKHFQIDTEKMSQFIKVHTPCDYCGERTGDVEKIDGEHVCEECLKQ